MSNTDSRNWWYSVASSEQGPASGAGGAPDHSAAVPGTGTGTATAAPATGSATSARLPSISLPKGGGAIRGIDEKLTVDQATGTASLTVGVYTSPARQGFGPSLALNYDSAGSNGPYGLGCSLGTPAITRKTSKGLPRYNDDPNCEGLNPDVFVFSGIEDLVPLLDKKGDTWTPRSTHRDLDGHSFEVRAYRPRVEAEFARIERWT
ncbi:SpvB/TcaC N-terminal domain-containing protein, partial [Mycobacterium sp.]|uniref:SpvB/TcaC N-terminal domain-containing protein n=1 Tax=Mycobacterium sp. TaxID=1785 RepID=UPI003C757335